MRGLLPAPPPWILVTKRACNWQPLFWKAELDCTLAHTYPNRSYNWKKWSLFLGDRFFKKKINHWTISWLFWGHTTPSVPIKLHFQHPDWTCTNSSQKKSYIFCLNLVGLSKGLESTVSMDVLNAILQIFPRISSWKRREETNKQKKDNLFVFPICRCRYPPGQFLLGLKALRKVLRESADMTWTKAVPMWP